MGMFAGIVVALRDSKVEYVSNPEVIKEVEVAPDWATDNDAVEAAKAVIKRKQLETELEKLESEVIEREERITEIEKELGVY